MKRIIIAVAAGALLSAGATFAWATHSGEKFPTDCGNSDHGTNITDGSITYDQTGLTVVMNLQGASCLAADYSVVVYDEQPDLSFGDVPVILDAISFPGDGTSKTFTVQRPVMDRDDDLIPSICVNVTTSTTQHALVTVKNYTQTPSPPPTGGGGNAPPMTDSDNDTDTDTISVDTETIADWGSNGTTSTLPCLHVDLGETVSGSGSRGMN